MDSAGQQVKERFKIFTLKGSEIIPYLTQLAQFRISIFKEYPYLYEGDLEYEKNYLLTYSKCSESILVLILDKEKIVGISTAIPMEFETIDFQRPFLEGSKIPITEIFYFGESLILPEYRGQKLYRYFFQERESAAKKRGCQYCVFAAVERSEDDSRKPKQYIPLDKVWEHFGYKKNINLKMQFKWKEIGEKIETLKTMIVWIKKIK